MSGFSSRRVLKVGKFGSIDEYFRFHNKGGVGESVDTKSIKRRNVFSVPLALMIDET